MSIADELRLLRLARDSWKGARDLTAEARGKYAAQVRAAHESGLSLRQIGRELGVSQTEVARLIALAV